MARKPAIENPNNFFHVTNQCINREWFTNMEQTWKIMSDQLWMTKRAFDLEIYSFVLMSNHFHLLVRAPKGNLSQAMAYFQSQSARRIQKGSGRTHRVFADRFKRCEIGDYQYFLATYRYIYQNPLRAGIVRNAIEYKYSTLHGLLGFARLAIPLIEDTILFEDVERTLNWLDERPNSVIEDEVRRALRRRNFEYSKTGKYLGAAEAQERALLAQNDAL